MPKRAAVTAVITARGSNVQQGHMSMKSFLKARLNCSGVEALRLRRAAALVDQHPAVGEALLSGRIATGHVARMAKAKAHPRAGERFSEFEPLLAEQAELLEHDDFVALVKHFECLADPDGAFDDQRFHEEERTATVNDLDGRIEISVAGGSPQQAAEMQRVFDLAAKAEYDRDCVARRSEFGDDALQHPLPRTSQQRRFDAIHAIFMAWATAPADGVAPEPLVNFVIDAATGLDVLARHGLLDVDAGPAANETSDIRQASDLANRRCATSTGVAVHPDAVLRAMLTGRVRRVMTDDLGVVIDMGRSQRLFTGKAREAAQLLVTTCSFRGCGLAAELCDIDHVDEWAAHGGRTDQANASPMCGVHDRYKHRAGLRGRRDVHGRIQLIRRDGSVITPVGARDPVWPPPDDDDVWEEITYEGYLELQSSEPDLTRLLGYVS